MFVILNVIGSGKRKIKRGRTVDKVHEFRTGGGERFYVVDVFDSGMGVNWDEVSVFIGKHSSKVLLDRNYTFPEFTPMKRFEPDKFRNILMFNTLNIILKELYLSGLRTKCYVNDKSGKYSFLLPGIVRYAAETVVITANEYRYFAQIQSLYDNLGAGVTVTDSIGQPEEHAFIIDTDGTFSYNGKGILFSLHNGIIPSQTEGFDDIKMLCPSYIDTLDFLGAVYELNRERRLSHAFCNYVQQNGVQMSVFELTEELKVRIAASPDRRKSIIFYV